MYWTFFSVFGIVREAVLRIFFCSAGTSYVDIGLVIVWAISHFHMVHADVDGWIEFFLGLIDFEVDLIFVKLCVLCDRQV